MNNFAQSTQQLFDAMSDTSILQASVPQCTHVSSIIVTGAGGFLGLHLLDVLSQEHNIKQIYAVVRSQQRFADAKKHYQLNFDESKITFIISDILQLTALPQADKLIHCAAKIHGLYSLKQMYRDNVQAAQHIYKLCTVQQIALTVVSTLSVFVSSNITGLHHEEVLPPNEEHILYGGYAQSKWLSDYLVPKNTTIIRLGLLTANSSNGIFPANDFFSTILECIDTVQCVPQNYEQAYVDISPVDLVANKIANILVSDIHHNIINIANSTSYALSSLLKQYAHFSVIENSQFMEELKVLPRLQQMLMMYAFFKSTALQIYPDYYNIDLFQSTNHSWSGSHLLQIHNENVVQCYLENTFKKIR